MDTVFLLISFISLMIGLVVHEFFHAWTAFKMGDPTAKVEGRLTLNPLKHLDPLGLVSLIVFKVGWAKPVPVNYGYLLNNGFKGPLLVALAGPLSNILLSLLGTLVSLLFVSSNATIFGILVLFSSMNLLLGLFNLFPIPPLDGGRILEAFSFKYRFLKPVVEFLNRYQLFILIGFLVSPFWGIFSEFVLDTYTSALYYIIHTLT